jgi:glycosyltransferase involved in cell wall biosynthesis
MPKDNDYSDLIVILPALNEELAITPTIERIQLACPGAEIVVVDNGSSDNTVQVVESLGIKILQEPQKGKGFAVRKGFLSVGEKHRYIFMVDADDTYGLEAINQAMELVDKRGYDMVVGTRIESDEIEPGRKVSYKRGHSIGNTVLTFFARKLHKVAIKDSLSGWRLMSVNFVKSFPGGASGFEIEAELNAHAYLISAGVANVEISYRGRDINSHSKLNTYRDGIKILRMNFSLFRDNRPQLAFSLFALPWLIVSTILISRAWVGYVNTGLVEQFPSLIAGIGSLIVSGLLLTSGIILQRIKLMRSNILRLEYQRFSNSA